MLRATELLQQGRAEDYWQTYCGFTDLKLEQFMTIQKRLLREQLELLNNCPLGAKIMRGTRPQSVEEFRTRVPITTYDDYCPELLEKREDELPVKPAMWVHTSGRSGDYPCKWIPMSPAFARELSIITYGLGNLASCRERGDNSRMPLHPKLVYTVAPRPYMTGAIASLLRQQTSIDYLPDLEKSEAMPFDERIKLGFSQALSQGFDYFFGLSMVLVTVGEKFSQSSDKVDIRPYLSRPKALFRLAKGLARSKLAKRPMFPRDLWSVRGIISSGLDSWVYRDRIKELWGRYPLDVYAGTEGGIYATQTWDYGDMTFIPNLNFLEFIPEEEHFKWQLDHSYQPRTLLLDEVKADENYEIIITNFHGGAMVRYRIGDLIKITTLRNERAGIDIPQMVFERRVDGLIDFVLVRLTEKTIWQAIEKNGIPYKDWTAYKEHGEPVLHLLIEPKDGYQGDKEEISRAIYQQIIASDSDQDTKSLVRDDFAEMINFRVETTILPHGAFAQYTAKRQAEGADLAHLKPPHLNPSDSVLSLLLTSPRTVEIRTKEEIEADLVGVK